MPRYLTAKVAQYAVLVAAALTLNFAAPRMMPGNPLVLVAGGDVSTLDPADQRALLAELGLDRPLGEQFARYLGQIASGDFGYSFHQKRPVAQILAERVGWTLLLAAIALSLATAVGLALGALAAWRRGHALDVALLAVFVFLESVPSFWLGMIAIALFAGQLHLLPSFGVSTPGRLPEVGDVAVHLVLPVAVLTVVQTGGTFLVTRYATLAALGEDYVTVARAKGVGGRLLLFRHVLRNALLPVFTVVMLNLGVAVGGATVVETVFSYPGVGRLLYEAVLGRDYPVLQAGFLVITLAVIAANLFADLIYPALDPRVRTRA